MTESKFKVGDWVKHPLHGIGCVSQVMDERDAEPPYFYIEANYFRAGARGCQSSELVLLKPRWVRTFEELFDEV